MADDNTTTPNKGLLKPIVGNSENHWGGYLNDTIDLLDAALGGTLTLAITGGTTLTEPQAVNTGYRFTGSLAGNVDITFPAYHGLAVVRNDTNRSLSCGIHGARVTIPTGQTITMWSDGADFTSPAIPAGSTAAPIMDSSATIGTSANWARADHIHPTDTKLLPKSGGTITGNLTVNNNLTAGMGGIKFTLPGTTNHAYAFGWTGTDLTAYVDGINVGQVVLQRASGLLSDDRKVSIEPSKVGLPEVLKLNPIRFRRIMADGHQTEVEEIGFSAQQVKKIIPEAVLSLGIILPDSSDGLDSVTSEVIVAALVNAVKTLERRLKKLEKGNISGEPD